MSSKKQNPIFWGILFLISAILAGSVLDARICPAADSFRAVVPGLAQMADPQWGLGENAVPTKMAVRIADVHAARVWGDSFTRGQPFLVYDKNGAPYSYVIPYTLYGDEFPSYDRIFQAVRTARARHPYPDKKFGRELDDLIGSMGCIEIAVNRSSYPVLVVRHSLHPYFLKYEEALAEARERLGSEEVTLANVEFNGPHELYFNFSSPAGDLKLHAYALKPPGELRPMPMFSETETAQVDESDGTEIIKRQKAQAWQEIETSGYETRAGSFKWIDNYALIPVVSWTHWCVPTAYTMTAGYWDHYNPGQGTWPGWGRIIDYWFDHPAICQNNNVTNVPNFIDEIITHEGNCSWANGGVIGVLNKLNGYKFTQTEITGTSGNDWCWPEIVSEVDSGRPCVWGAGPKNGHAMTAWGYRIVGSQKFVLVYNTWGATAAAQTAEYNYTEWEGEPNTQTGVGKLWPGGGTGSDHAVLHSHRGEETVFGSTEISWFVWGNKIVYTSIYFSSDGGTTWKSVPNGLYRTTAPGWNTYQTDLSAATTTGRIAIVCFGSDLTFIAGDGSPQNFIVQGKPDLIPVSICKKDSEGNILIQVKNNGSVIAGPSITRVIFYPSGFNDLLFPSIAPGATAEVPVAAPGSCWNPDCDYKIQVDSTGWVDESDETNNMGSGACIS